MRNDLQHAIALSFVPQVGAVTARNLVSYCGNPEAVFRASRAELLKIPGIGPTTADNIRAAAPLQLAERELDYIARHGIEPIFYTDAHFPRRLRQLPDAPALVYFHGSDLALLDAPRIVAIVGTRQPSEYGKAFCEELVEDLKKYNAVVVSGLAYGIDVTAHKRATALGIANIGVLGSGLGRLYPATHRAIAEKMLENGGLLTEYAHQTGPDREHFPMRNRIIAGLADALVVVETGDSGGSLISAELAGQYDRYVFAVPGRVRDPKSIGCNLLIKNEKAHLLESVADIAAKLEWDTPDRPRARQTQLFLDLTPAETGIVEVVRSRPEIAIDDLTLACGLPPGELAALILGLEFRGILRTLPGKRYLLVG